MFSSAFFFLAVKLSLYLRVLAPFFQKKDRQLQKVKLLSFLRSLKNMNFSEIAAKVILLADRTFSVVGGSSEILSIRYMARFSVAGLFLGLLFSIFSLMFIVSDIAQAMRVLQKQYWWQFVFLPSVLTAAFLTPIDIACAHALIRWGLKGKVTQNYIVFLAALPLAYVLWAVGAGLAVTFGIFISSNIFIPSFFWNRINAAFFNPMESSGSMQIGMHWFSYGLLAASSALSSFLVSVMFLVVALLKSSPAPLQKILVAPLFLVLEILNWLECRQFDFPIGVMAWLISGVLFTCALMFRYLGF